MRILTRVSVETCFLLVHAANTHKFSSIHYSWLRTWGTTRKERNCRGRSVIWTELYKGSRACVGWILVRDHSLRNRGYQIKSARLLSSATESDKLCRILRYSVMYSPLIAPKKQTRLLFSWNCRRFSNTTSIGGFGMGTYHRCVASMNFF